jgi:hypothetical protein
VRRAFVMCVMVLCLGAVTAAGATAATGDRAKAKAVAVKAVGGGTATSVERRSNGRGWEVYVRRAGKTYEVKLSPAFRVQKVERQGANDDAGDDKGGDRGGNGSDDG